MKKFLVVLMCCAFLLFSGCDLLESLLGGGTEESGSIVLSLSDGVSRTLTPGISMVPVSYHLDGAGPGGANFAMNLDSSSSTVADLLPGEWTITATARNAEGASIGAGSGTVTVAVGQSSILQIVVRPFAGSGGLDLSLSWPAAELSAAHVEATLTPMSGDAEPLTFVVDRPAGTADCGIPAVPAGYYTLTLKLLDGGALCMGAVEIVRVVANSETVGTYEFNDVNSSQATLETLITPEMNDPLEVAISGAMAEKTEAETLFLSAQLSNYDGNAVFVWYVNSVEAAFGESFAFGPEWAPGAYRIDVTAFSADGTRAGSATANMTVVAGGTPEPIDPDAMALIGDGAIGWGEDKFTLATKGAGFHYAITWLNPGQVMFRTPGTWNGTNVGVGAQTAPGEWDLLAGNDPARQNIIIENPGFYYLELDFVAMTVKALPVQTLGVVGDAVGSWDADIDLWGDMWTDQFSVTVEAVDGSYKFRANDDWILQWGTDASNSVLDAAGQNIATAAGTYVLTLDGRTMTYTAVVSTDPGPEPSPIPVLGDLALIGSAVGSWDVDKFTFRTDAQGCYSAITWLEAGDCMFRTPGSWVGTHVRLGPEVGPNTWGILLSTTGPLLQVDSPGYYFIKIDPAAGTILAQPVWSLGVIGSATAGFWDWDTDLAGDPATDVFTLTTDFFGGDWRLRLNDAWDYNLGDLEMDGFADVYGANMLNGTQGTMTLSLDGRTMAYSLTAATP